MVVALIIIVFAMFYTNYLSKQLAEKEIQYILFFTGAQNSVRNSKDDTDLSLQLTIIDKIKNPIILDDGSGELSGYNWSDDKDLNQKFLLDQMLEIQNSGLKPIIPVSDENSEIDIENRYPRIYYKQSQLYSMITWFPLVQVVLIGVFVLFGYMIFSSVRRAEQNRVWVGMSKETAHQLGTPISGIMGWAEYLKTVTSPTEDQLGAITELEKDVHKLELIANRFSKIGSVLYCVFNNKGNKLVIHP